MRIVCHSINYQIYNILLSVHALVSIWSNLTSSPELQGQKVSQSTIKNISETWGRDRRGIWGRWRRRNLGWRPTPCRGPLCHTRQVLHRRGVGLWRLCYSSTGHQPEDLRAGGGQDHQQEKWVAWVITSVHMSACTNDGLTLLYLQIWILKTTKTCATKRW